jgi:hypothetical protein
MEKVVPKGNVERVIGFASADYTSLPDGGNRNVGHCDTTACPLMKAYIIFTFSLPFLLMRGSQYILVKTTPCCNMFFAVWRCMQIGHLYELPQ